MLTRKTWLLLVILPLTSIKTLNIYLAYLNLNKPWLYCIKYMLVHSYLLLFAQWIDYLCNIHSWAVDFLKILLDIHTVVTRNNMRNVFWRLRGSYTCTEFYKFLIRWFIRLHTFFVLSLIFLHFIFDVISSGKMSFFNAFSLFNLCHFRSYICVIYRYIHVFIYSRFNRLNWHTPYAFLTISEYFN